MVGAGELLNSKPCPSWLPDFLCNSFGQRQWTGLGLPRWIAWVLIVLLALLAYKMLR